MARIQAIGKELVDHKYKFTIRFPLLHDIVLRDRFDLDLLCSEFVLRQLGWYGFREYILKFDPILENRIF